MEGEALQIFPLSSPPPWPVSDSVSQTLTFCYHLPPLNLLHLQHLLLYHYDLLLHLSASWISLLFACFPPSSSTSLPLFLLAFSSSLFFSVLSLFPLLPLHVVVVVRKDSCTPWCSCVLCGRRGDCLLSLSPSGCSLFRERHRG